jgi:predicted ArsR family transcriptional regulator
MKDTREQVIELLRQHGELTVAELAEKLGIAAPAVRRHLDILAGEALVEYRTVRQHTGRPYFAYSLTERAVERDSTGYSRLVERLLREVSALDGGEPGGRLLETVLARMSEHLAEEHRGQVRGATLEERAASLVRALAEEGLLDSIEVREDGVHLINSICPYRRAALTNSALCRSEQRTIALLLGTEVEQVSRIADGRPRCEYVVCGPHPGAADLTLV